MPLTTPSPNQIKNKTVLVRTDYNVPLKKGRIQDPRRINRSFKTLKFLSKNQAKVVVMSHLGRPGGKTQPSLSLQVVADYLQAQLKTTVKFCPEPFGPQANKLAKNLKPGQILLLENLRFTPLEKQNSPQLGQALAQLADVYLNEAFSVCHRAHASVVAVTQKLPSMAGFNLVEEIKHLEPLMNQPAHPFVMVVGGAKISDKAAAVQNLHQIADLILVGGGVANNFLKAQGIETHQSVIETKVIAQTKKLLAENQTEKILKDDYIPLPKILLPVDVVAAKNKQAQKTQVIELTKGMKDTPHDKKLQYLDLGPKTIKLYTQLLAQAKTIFWNGPMGVFEKNQFASGTKKIAQAIAQSSGKSIVGGGDTGAAITQFKMENDFTYISSAGGAALEFLAGKKLPGLEALKK